MSPSVGSRAEILELAELCSEMYSLRELCNRQFILHDLGERISGLSPEDVSKAIQLAVLWRRGAIESAYHTH